MVSFSFRINMIAALCLAIVESQDYYYGSYPLPALSLVSDLPGADYSGCLAVDGNNRSIGEPGEIGEAIGGCWKRLNLTIWLPLWFATTDLCDAENATKGLNCNRPGEPWTTTLLRQIHGPSGRAITPCVDILSTTCGFDDLQRAFDGLSSATPLLRARYLYVYSAIFRK